MGCVQSGMAIDKWEGLVRDNMFIVKDLDRKDFTDVKCCHLCFGEI